MTDNIRNLELQTAIEIAGSLKVPLSWIYERTRRRGPEQIPHYKLGKYLRFDLAEVNKWISTMQRG
jgi:predicted DNA-binding transcriptional regulator AlpA